MIRKIYDNDEPTCMICTEEYDSFYKKNTMQCGHSACRICLSLMIDHDKKTIKCPVCRTKHRIAYKFTFLNPFLSSISSSPLLSSISSSPPLYSISSSPPSIPSNEDSTMYYEWMFVKMFILFAFVIIFKIYERQEIEV